MNVGARIRTALLLAGKADGLRRTQSWLAVKIGMSEPLFSRKVHGLEKFKQEELEEIDLVLGTNFATKRKTA